MGRVHTGDTETMTNEEQAEQGGQWRVLLNPDDGTSTIRWRIVEGEGLATRVVAFGPIEADAEYIIALEAENAALKTENERNRQDNTALRAALSRIDYLCGEPNGMEVSPYDAHQSEQAVIETVRDTIELLKADAARLEYLLEAASDINALIADLKAQ